MLRLFVFSFCLSITVLLPTQKIWAQQGDPGYGIPPGPVDSTWLHYGYQTSGVRVPYNTASQSIDARINYSSGSVRYYLQEGKTFSYRGTDTYFPMAGFASQDYTQGNLRRIFFGADLFDMNYRLLHPKNYASNPEFQDGYPLIVMTHGLGEIGNCSNAINGGSCYFPNQNWDPAKTTPERRDFVPKTYNVISAAQNGVNPNSVIFTISETHLLTTGTNVINISGASEASYNGNRTVTAVTGTTITVSVAWNGTTTAVVKPLNQGLFTPASGNMSPYTGSGNGELVMIRTNEGNGFDGIRRFVKINNTTFRLSSNYNANATATANLISYRAGFTSGTIERYIPMVNTVTSAASAGGNLVTFTTSTAHQFSNVTTLNGHQVLISNSTVPAYNGTFNVVANPLPTTTTFTVSISGGFSGTATALAAKPTVAQQLLNNDHNMVHGGAVHRTAVNAVPAGMTPDDPSMPTRAFPGFVLFPQNMNTWSTGRREDSKVIILIRLLMKKYNIDPNRIYIHGLSDGGAGAYKVARSAPWLFSAVLPMSAVDNAQISNHNLFQYVRTIPVWAFQGGTDGNPTPIETQDYIKQYKTQGMSARYTLYPNLGHGVWNNAYAEPDFFTWMLQYNKSDIFVRYGKTEICGTTGDGVVLELAQGFYDYQWEQDGTLISGENTYFYTANLPGTYRARFSRKPNPGESDWNHWSKPVTITESTPIAPVIAATGTMVFPTINGTLIDNSVKLYASEKADRYYWYKNGSETPFVHPGTLAASQDTISQMTLTNGGGAGFYTLRTADFGNCPSPLSNEEYFVWNAPATLTAPSAFAGQATSYSTIFLSWTDNSNTEKGFEVWRRKDGETNFKFIVRTTEDAVSYEDRGLEPNTTYQYKLRAISNTARSVHAPSDNVNTNLVVSTPNDGSAPTAPQNLTITSNNATAITLAWTASTDDSGIKQYVVTYGGQSVTTNSTLTSFTLTGLTLNSVYPITVQAEDLGGNLSEPSNQVMGSTYIQGVFFGHSTGAWTWIDPVASAGAGDTPPMQWNTFEFYGTITNPNFNVNIQPSNLNTGGSATQSDFYNFMFDGYIDVPDNSAIPSTPALTQTYQFRTTSDDGSMLFIDGFDPNNLTLYQQVDNDGLHGNTTEASGDITLTPGPHRIVILYFERTGGQSLTVEYRIRRVGTNNFTGWAPLPKISGSTNNPSNLPLRSGNYIAPTAPVAPTSLSATATGMTTIDLAWLYGGAGTDEFEIYRATTLNGEYSIIHRATIQNYTDNTGLPGTMYYYKLKTVNGNGSSAFSTVVSAQTFTDNLAPSAPSFLTLASKTYTNVAFTWTASTDNIGVTGYEVLIDGVVTDTIVTTSYMAMNLNPGTIYNFTVKAFDASGNKSAASSGLLVTTNLGQIFYSKSTGNLNVTGTWGINTDGSGTAPNFTLNGQIYQVANRTSTDLGGSLTIQGTASRLIIPTDVTFIVDQPLSAKLEVQGNAVVQLDHETTPEFVIVSPTSTINFNASNTIAAGQYGNIVLTGSGNKNFNAGETTIFGDLTAYGQVALKGAPGNTSKLTLHGNLEITDIPGLIASDNALDLVLANPTGQNITTAGSIDFYRITTQPNTTVALNSSSPVTLNVGSVTGGGLVLANGSALTLGNNHLNMKFAGAINPGGETGKLAINGSNLTLASSRTQNSNLHLDAALHTAGLVTSTFSGTGKLMVQSPLIISDGLKIKGGEVSSAGNIRLVSTASKTAYLHEIEGTGTLTGDVKVERWVSAVRKYRYMSSVVADLKVADWQDYMPVTGPFTGANTNATAASMFYYVENNGGYKQYPPAGGTNQVTFTKGRGYAIFNYNGNNPLTLTMNGNPYQGNVEYTSILTSNAANTPTLGWNLIANPYASAIQWNNVVTEWTKNGIAPGVSVPDNSSGTLVFRTYDAVTGLGTLTGGIIAPGQAFWVRTINASPTLTVTEKAKRTNNSALYREGSNPANHFVVKLSGSTQQDNAYVILGDKYADTFEPAADGTKYKNQVVNLSTRSSDQVNLVFNKLSDSFCEKTVPLTIEDVEVGNYTLSFANINNLVGVGEIMLTDNFTNTTISATDSEAYNFTVTSDAASKGTARFVLHINRPALQKTAVATVANVCGNTQASIQLTNTQAGVFYYATIPGDSAALSAEVTSNGGTVTLDVPVNELQAGINNLVIYTGFKGCSNELLTATPLTFTFTPAPDIRVEEYFYSICEGTPLTLKAETLAGSSFHWYANGELIANQTGATLYTDLIKKSTRYEVAAVTANGCEGERIEINVETESVQVPILDFDGEAITLVGGVPQGIFVQWYKDQEPLDVFTPFIQPEEEGQYTVLLSSNGCSRISNPFNFAITAVEPETDNVFAAYVYPNPASHDNLYIKLETPSKQDVVVTLIDMAGRKSFTTQLTGTGVDGVHKITLPQTTMPGMYLVTIQQGEVTMQRKLVVTF